MAVTAAYLLIGSSLAASGTSLTILRDGINDDPAACPQDDATYTATAVRIAPARLVMLLFCSLLRRTRIARPPAGLGHTESMSQHHVRPEANEALYRSSVTFSGPCHATCHASITCKLRLFWVPCRADVWVGPFSDAESSPYFGMSSVGRAPAGEPQTSHSKIYLFPHSRRRCQPRVMCQASRQRSTPHSKRISQ